jgi:hypothetical protein
LIDAGIGQCVQGEALCQVRSASGYERIRVRGAACQEADGGWAVIPEPEAIADVQLIMTHEGAACRRATGGNQLSVGQLRRTEAHECACASANAQGVRAADNCESLDAGNWVSAPPRVHFKPGQFRGACAPVPCGQLAGVSAWPSQCGPESL